MMGQEEIRRIKKAIAKNERRIKAGKPVPNKSVDWHIKRDLLVQRLAQLEGRQNVDGDEAPQSR